MPETDDLFAIIDRGMLRRFLLGRLDTDYSDERPEQDYARWDRLRELYGQLPNDSGYRDIIEQELKGLIRSESPEEIAVGVTLTRLLGLQSAEGAIEELVRKNVYRTLPDHIQDLILQTSAELRFGSLRHFLIEEVVKKEKVVPFLTTWSSRPAHVGQVFADDLWRMRLLAEYYEHHSQSVDRASVEDQLAGDHARKAQLMRFASALLDQERDSLPEFRAMVQRIHGGS